MAKATYYIRIDTYWQNSPDEFVGPFSSREEAQREIDAAVAEGKVCMASHMAADLRNGIRVHGILSKTAAQRSGMKAGKWYGEGNMIGMRIPRSINERRRVA
jgi:hypothetical protein